MNTRNALLESTAVVLTLLTVTATGSAQVTYDRVSAFDQSVPAATQPTSGVIKGVDGAFYGLTQNNNFCGAVYKLLPDGTRTILHIFKGSFAAPPDGPDGCQPVGELVQGADGLLYGVTLRGGPNHDSLLPSESGTGTIFRISPQGDSILYEIVHAFAGTIGNGVFPEGILPAGGLTIAKDGNFYGTTSHGGTDLGNCNGTSPGTFYQLTPGGAFTVKHHFHPATEGCSPRGNLTLGSDGNLLGTTIIGGLTQTELFFGTVFKITPSGALTTLFSFPHGTDIADTPCGASPTSAPVEGPDGTLYGVAQGGPRNGGNELGVVYKLAPGVSTCDASVRLHAFTGPDGAQPMNLTLGSDGNLYGVTSAGGSASSQGTVFQITTTGALTAPPLHTFGCADRECTASDPNDGFGPEGRLLETSPGRFIGTTRGGNGSSLGGSVFSITLASATTTVLSVSANNAVFGQSVTLTATVSAAPDTPSGTVRFFDGQTSIGAATLTNGQAGLSTTALAIGTHTISARYEGSSTFLQSTSSPVSITVSPATTSTTLSSSANPSRSKQTVTISATVVAVLPGSGVPTGSVQLLDGKKKLGTIDLVNGVARFDVVFKGMGSHNLTAVYAGDGNFAASASAPLTQTVGK